MPSITIVPIQTLDSTGISSGTRQWPGTLQDFKLTLLDAQFVSGVVGLEVEFSWDGGSTWTWIDPNQWPAGSKDRQGNAPAVAYGPFRKGEPPIVNNPSHGRARIFAVSGSPRVGVSLTI